MKQILINLVKNAIKFTRKGAVTILASYDNEKGMLAIKVFDTGTGIAPEEIPELTKKFGKLFRTA